jgi:hypothetical protein
LAKRIRKNSKNIQVFVADMQSEQNNIEFTELVELPFSKSQISAKRYCSKRSNTYYCFGKLMLKRAISDFGFQKEKINQFYYSDNDKSLINIFTSPFSLNG